MKKLMIILLLLITLNLFSYNKKIVNTTIRSAAEEIITKSGYSLLNQAIQEEALKEQSGDNQEDNCIDDTCLMDTGKMLAAQRLFVIKISNIGSDNYLFKISNINLETNENTAVFSEIYTGKLNNATKLFDFSKKFLKGLLKTEKKLHKEDKTPVMLEIIFAEEKTTNKENNENIKTHILNIKTQYDPVNIYEGSKLLGITPIKLLLKEGLHTITFEKEGYSLLDKKIRLKKDIEITNIAFKIEKKLKLISKIPKMDVYINNQYIGTTDDKGEFTTSLKIGKYLVELRKDSYDSVNKSIELKNNLTIKFDETYKTGGPYPIKINTKIKSKVYLNNDKFLGFTPLVVELKSGDYTFNIYNNIVKNEKHKVSINKPLTLLFKANKTFNFIEYSLNSEYIYTNFSFQKNSNHFLLGLDLSLFKWRWKYFNIDILGGGFYFGLNSYKMLKLHLGKLNITPISNLTINLAIGPLLGDFTNLYDNIQDSYISYGGLNIAYQISISKYFSLNLKTSINYATKNSKKSFYKENDNSMIEGMMYSVGLGIISRY